MLVTALFKPLHLTLALFKALPLVSLLFAFDDSSLVVQTASGLVRGSRMTSSKGLEFLAFRGIPYAKPPVDELRFEDPVEIEPWNGIFDATKESPECPQYEPVFFTLRGTEDCLRINVYTHSIDPKDSKWPVLVYIHEGVWNYGSGNGGNYFHGPNYFMDRDVILVTFNYRIGALGFLSTDDDVAPGNYGMLDQVMALRWVKKNIETFGGDPNLITIFGSSVGGASVEHHILSPRSRGLFTRAIMQSGSALCFWAAVSTNFHYTKLLAAHLKCPTSPSRDLVSCLRTRKALDMVRFRVQTYKTIVWPTLFGPRVDTERANPFLPKPPTEIFRSGEFSRIPIIAGVNRDEGGTFVAGLLSGGGRKLKRFEQGLPGSLSLALGVELDNKGNEKSIAAYERYFGELKKPSRDLHSLSKMQSHAGFFVCFHQSVKYHTASGNPVYAYVYSHRSVLTVPLALGIPRFVRDFGVSHFDEVLVQFNLPIVGYIMRKPDDVRMTEVMLDYWVSFAKTGIPESQRATTQWLPSTSTGEVSGYMELSSNPIFRNSSFSFAKDMPFWEGFYNY